MFGILLEFLVTLLLVIKAIVIATIFAFIPAPKKCVKNKIILVTGAGSGIGQLMCEDFAKRGAIIVAWDISATGNEQTARLIKESGGRVHTYACDVSDKKEVYRVADQVKKDVGDVDILINNAGIVTGKNFMDCTDDELMRTMNINVHAHFWTVKKFLPAMLARNSGQIVTIASMAGIIGTNTLTDYCTSKFANVGFTESLALELEKEGKNGIVTTTICPYKIRTGMFDGAEGRFPLLLPDMTAEYAAGRIVTAVLTNQRILCMPRAMYQLAALKGILPVDAASALNRFFGGLDFMSGFVGRNKKN